jgi:hypothetical protein
LFGKEVQRIQKSSGVALGTVRRHVSRVSPYRCHCTVTGVLEPGLATKRTRVRQRALSHSAKLNPFPGTPLNDPFTGMGWPGVTRIVARRFVRVRAAEKSAKWRKMVTLRHCWHPRTLFLLAQDGLDPHAVGVPRPLVDACLGHDRTLTHFPSLHVAAPNSFTEIAFRKPDTLKTSNLTGTRFVNKRTVLFEYQETASSL